MTFPIAPRYHLTFDIDWAPDWAIFEVLDTLSEFSAPATFFATHRTAALAEIERRGHELGIHPNFLAGSSHGSDPLEVMRSILEIAPRARVMRTHSLVQATTLFEAILASYPQIAYDMSLLTYGSPHTGWTPWHSRGRAMSRLNYNWEDDIAFDDPHQDWASYLPSAAVDVLDFHPIHVALNSRGEAPYMALKRKLGAGHLHEATRDEAQGLRDRSPGTADYLRAVLESRARPLSFEELL